MSQGSRKKHSVKGAGDQLEPYRRLVELQKQMIELAQQNAQSRRECEALRAQVDEEVAARLRSNTSLDPKLRDALWQLSHFNRRESSC